MTSSEFNDLWKNEFAPVTKAAMPNYGDFMISERMLEDYLDIFRGYNTRRDGNAMPYPHPFFDSNGKPLLPVKPCIKFILVAEARPMEKPKVLNQCLGDEANTFFYNITHVGRTPWLNAPRLFWKCPPFRPCPNNKVQTLLCLASKGVLLLDLFPFAIKYSTNLRKALNDNGTTRRFWEDSANPYNLQDRIKGISNLLCEDWDLTMVAPCIISENLVNPSKGASPLAIVPPGLHPRTFRLLLPDNTRCIVCKVGHEWKKIAFAQQGPTAKLIGQSF
jgi:hypothetical protein